MHLAMQILVWMEEIRLFFFFLLLYELHQRELKKRHFTPSFSFFILRFVNMLHNINDHRSQSQSLCADVKLTGPKCHGVYIVCNKWPQLVHTTINNLDLASRFCFRETYGCDVSSKTKSGHMHSSLDLHTALALVTFFCNQMNSLQRLAFSLAGDLPFI